MCTWPVVLHSLAENDIELDILPIDWPRIPKLNPKINSPGKHYLVKRCHTWLQVNQLNDIPSGGEPGVYSGHIGFMQIRRVPQSCRSGIQAKKNIYRPIWLLPYQNNYTLLTATRFTMEQIGVATGLYSFTLCIGICLHRLVENNMTSKFGLST